MTSICSLPILLNEYKIINNDFTNIGNYYKIINNDFNNHEFSNIDKDEQIQQKQIKNPVIIEEFDEYPYQQNCLDDSSENVLERIE